MIIKISIVKLMLKFISENNAHSLIYERIQLSLNLNIIIVFNNFTFTFSLS